MASAAKPQIIDTPEGGKLVVLPLAEYEKLRAAARAVTDVAAYDAAKRRLKAGEDELVPAEIANRLVDGENPVRVWRSYRGMTLAELSKAAGISQPYLSQIENGSRDGTVSTMRALAGALSVDLEDII
ncbi:MAG: transcriptional regulator [Alphaproteobacteria bacterium HGW-Alphaproteobacteria-12]|nr:MAG: transcriptional regulator [Alphaproteobacteria bacterium HGW-Alphaproteobacteria-12]